MSNENGRSWPGRAILHVDMDAFFASVEQLDHPEWRGKPVIVGGAASSRGVVSAASYEARRFGVHSAMPSARAAKLAPNAVWAPPRFERYSEVSRKVRDIFEDETPRVEPTSIDEAYLDVTPGKDGEDPVEVARRIQRRVGEIGLSCSIGVATSKTVAKVASDHDKPHGLTVVPPGGEAAFLAPLPVRALTGIGAVTERRVRAVGIRTLGQLAALDDVTAVQLLGEHGVSLVRRAAGADASEVVVGHERKSVSKERTFAHDISDVGEVDAALARLAAGVGEQVRRKGLAGRTVTVKVRFADFTTRSAQQTLGVATDLESEFLPVARALLRQLWAPGTGMRLLGLGLSGFSSPAEQLDLFAEEPANRERRRALAQGIDAVRRRFGDDAIERGMGRRGKKPE